MQLQKNNRSYYKSLQLRCAFLYTDEQNLIEKEEYYNAQELISAYLIDVFENKMAREVMDFIERRINMALYKTKIIYIYIFKYI